ncbi:MAG: hypothetical protein IK078_02530 [Lachnospiraceae bacterium]|nr:hypothetical protein [Lachnospiraceae bacterium]
MKEHVYSRYIEIMGELVTCNDPEEFGQLEAALSEIEDSNIEIIGGLKYYADCLADRKSDKRTICFIGVELHGAARYADEFYEESEIYWLQDVEDVSCYNQLFDDVIVSGGLLDDCIDRLKPIAGALKKEGIVHFFPDNKRRIKLVLDYCCVNGLLLTEELGFSEIIDRFDSRKDDMHVMEMCACPATFDDNTAITIKPLRGVAKYKKVYVPCFPFIKTGGTELLHQLVYWLNRFGCEAYIAYGKVDDEKPYCEPQLMRYVSGHICTLPNGVEDNADNAMVVAEQLSGLVNQFDNIHKLFWWLSVDGFFVSLNNDKAEIDRRLNQIKHQTDYSFIQSVYAGEFLREKGFDDDCIIRLEDYINSVFITEMEGNLDKEKEDIVIYNPAKGKEFTRKLISEAGDINWVPICNMTTSQVHDLMCRAKVYIDFGPHPGKDRMPRESAACGCCIITGKRGSAKYHEDVFINEEYKFDEQTCQMKDILNMIRRCITEYDVRIDDFSVYRDHIRYEKTQFVEDIQKSFFG